jgi:hypothetical protein
MENKKFNPLIFLMSLGAGGITIIPFAFFQYIFEHGPGLVKYSDIGHGTLSLANEILFRSFEGIMIVFTIIHLVLSVFLIRQLVGWIRVGDYKEMIGNPLKNAGVLAPFISIVMTMNVGIGPIRFFLPAFAENLQMFMLPALLFWIVIWVALMWTEMFLLKVSFEKSFDVNKISFGWLLHPFALSMLTVTGTGIAAMARSAGVAHTAAFMSLISGTLGLFLLAVKVISIFKSHFVQTGLPERQFMPSFLIVIPNITLFAISGYRLGHYLEVWFGFHMAFFQLGVVTVAFAFEVWYMMFGLTLLSGYLKNHFFNGEFYVTQWGLVCPLVAFGVLGSFVYSVFLQSFVFYVAVLVTTVIVVSLFFILFLRQGRCSGYLAGKGIRCL